MGKFKKVFRSLPDPRADNARHDLLEILVVALAAVLCGAGEFWRDVPYRAVTVDPFACRDQHVLFKREIDWVQRCGRSVAECPSHQCMPAIDVMAVQSNILSLLKL